MKESIPDNQLMQMSDFVAAHMGLYFPRERLDDLERYTKSAAEKFNFLSTEAFIQWLVSSPLTQEQIEILASHLTISETYFWREPRVFDALCDQILPELIHLRGKSDKRLRLWSAGCATGEEAYSIAIALCKIIPDIENWNITLLATDINSKVLHKAMIGTYGEWSFRNVPPGFKEEYFRRTSDGKFAILPAIRKMVTFAYLNLNEDVYPSPVTNTNAMDIIFCRNVLMYFVPECARLVGQRFYNSMVQGGWFMVSAGELSKQLFPQFTTVNFPGAIVYHRDTQKPVIHEDLPIALKQLKSMLVPQPTMDVAAGIALNSLVQPQQIKMPQAAKAVQTVPAEILPSEITLNARTLANQGKLSEARVVCEQAITLYKLDLGLHYLYANILQEINQVTEAVVELNRTLYIDPNFVLAYFTLGNLAQRQGKAAEAKKHFKNVLEILSTCGSEEIVAESEGLTVGRLREIVRATIQIGVLV